MGYKGPSRELLNGATAKPSNELGSSCFGLQIINNHKIKNRTNDINYYYYSIIKLFFGGKESFKSWV